MLFEWLFPKKELKVNDKQEFSLKNELEVEDKHWAIILSYGTVALSGIGMSIKYESTEYLLVSDIAIGILIGSYIPIDSLLKNKPLKELLNEYWENIKKTFKDSKLIIVSSLIFSFMFILCILPNRDIQHQISWGILTGVVIFIVILFTISTVKKVREKNEYHKIQMKKTSK